MGILITLAVLTAFVLFTEILTVKIIISDEKTLEFSLMIFALALKFGKEPLTEAKRGVRYPSTASLLRFIFSVAEISNVEIKALSIPLPDSTPQNDALTRGILLSAIAAFIGFAKENTGFFSFGSIFFDRSEHNNLKLEASVKVPLFRFLVRLIPFLLNYLSAPKKTRRVG